MLNVEFSIVEGRTLAFAEGFDGNRTPPNFKTTTAEAYRHNLNGGRDAILSWSLPLVVAIVIAIGLMVYKPWKPHKG